MMQIIRGFVTGLSPADWMLIASVAAFAILFLFEETVYILFRGDSAEIVVGVMLCIACALYLSEGRTLWTVISTVLLLAFLFALDWATDRNYKYQPRVASNTRVA